MSKTKNFYSYPHDTKAIAFIDIIGFGELTKKFQSDDSLAQLVFTAHENCILYHRRSMLDPSGFKREVPADLSASGHTQGFWYKEVPDGAVNFIYLSDSVVMYSSSISHLVRELSSIFGAALIWAVPMRAVITVGDLEHSEWIERPGSAICLYGSALTKAAEIEKSKSGSGMRIWLDGDAEALANSIPNLRPLIETAPTGGHAELKWWLGALNGTEGRTESQEIKYRYDRWYSEKNTKHWFTGSNKTDTDTVIAHSIKDMENLGR